MNRYIYLILLNFICFNTNYLSATETDELEDDKLNQTINGQPAIFLDEDQQKSSGLQTIKLKTVQFQPEFITFGKAISVSPLLSILNQYLSVSSKQAAAKARFTQAEKKISRLRNLHKNKAISTRKLQEQQSKWQSEKAIYDESVYQSMTIINSSKLEWGEKITHWATGKRAPIFDNLIKGKSTLLRVTLPAGQSLSSKIDTILINSTGNKGTASKATFISQLPKVDSLSQGLQYLFYTENPLILSGMNFTAWIPQQNQSQEGVIIPESSLIWHLGQAFVFIKVDEEYFVHRDINNSKKINKGYFVQNQIAEDDEIVTIGTQMLLSHEFRSQIPEEDDD